MTSDEMIHIFLDIQDGPWGGGNQFLKALRHIYRAKKVYAENLEQAQIILVNSHHFESGKNLERLLITLQRKPEVTVIHRLDGPVTLIRGTDEGTDNLIFRFNKLFADGSVFQSSWCFDHCRKLGLEIDKPYKLIANAPDPDIFFPAVKSNTGQKIKLVATSWSSNPVKGFDIYQWMDRNVDWNKYEMTFVGNSPVSFENISHIPPVDSKALGDLLRQHDIFITASRADPCSNSLIEALHCGLPALAMRDGGHPELVGKGGEFFEKGEDIPALLQKLAADISGYREKISLPNLDEVAQSYLDFMVVVHNERPRKKQFSQTDCKNFLSLYKKREAPTMMQRGLARFHRIFPNRRSAG